MPKGTCLCGAVAYEAATKLEAIDHCHCSMCRRSHGAAFATYGRVAKDHLVIHSGEDSIKTFSSSEAVNRRFCSRCGSSLFFLHNAMPDFVFIAVGTLDEDPGGRPEAHIFASSKADWYTIEDALPRHDGYPPQAGE